MRKSFKLIWLMVLPMMLGLAACTDTIDNPVTPDDSQATTKRVKELKSKLQNSYLYYPILVDNKICGAFSFNLLEDGVASRMGMVTLPDWKTIASSEDFDLKVDSCDISWDVVPNYQGFSSDGLTGDALRITMKSEQGQTQDVYYTIDMVNEDSVKLIIPSEYGPQEFVMWRFENSEHNCVTEFTSAVSIVSAVYIGEMLAFVEENIEKLSGQTDEDRMAFLQESGLDKLTDWVYDFDNMDASARKQARLTTRAATRAANEPDYPNWMARIGDNVKLRDMVIPGSHDATTYGINILMKSFGMTQPLNLSEQWDRGARAFDLRVRYDRGEVRLFHNFIPCNMTLEDVAYELNRLVKNHPTEGAIVIVNGEGNDGSSSLMELIKLALSAHYHQSDLVDDINLLYSSSELDESLTMQYSSPILRNNLNLAEYHPDMTLGDLRGKILIIFRSDKDKSITSASYASGWDDDNRTLARYNGAESAVLRVQDNYGQGDNEEADTYLNNKVRDFNNLWDASEKATDKPTWYVNCPSGYVWDIENFIPNYYKVAETCYPQIIKKISSHMGRGIILQDFTGVSRGDRLLEDIIRTMVVLKHTYGSVVEFFEKGFEKLKDFGKKVVDTIVDTYEEVKDTAEEVVEEVVDWFKRLFGARSFTPAMLNTARTRGEDTVYELYGDMLVKACVANNYIYGDRVDYKVDLGKVTSNYVAKDDDVLTGTLGSNVKISIADGATVTLKDVTINGINNKSYAWAGINCEGDATIILKGANSVRGFYMYPGIYVPQGKTLTIKGDGSLNAIGNRYTAGIGAGWGPDCGNIIITGGTINATGGQHSAGIGGGFGGSCGNITITSGVTSVTATKGEQSQYSIGEGVKCYPCTVTIGGKVTGNISESPYTYKP